MHIDDTETTPQTDDTTVSETEEVTAPEGEIEEGDEGAEGLTQEELEEIERNGKTYRIPKELKGELLMHADYTKKTQAAAEMVRATEAREAAIAQREAAFRQDAEEYASLVALGKSIEQYEQTITQLRQQGRADEAQRYWQDLMEMRHAAGRLSYGLQQKQQARQAETEREYANRIRDRDAALAKDIQGFTPALMSKIEQYAVSDGYTPQEAQSLADPRYVKTLNKARLWDEYQANTKKAVVKAKQQEQPVVTQTPTVTARKSPERLSAELAKRDPDEWVRRRNKELGLGR